MTKLSIRDHPHVMSSFAEWLSGDKLVNLIWRQRTSLQ